MIYLFSSKIKKNYHRNIQLSDQGAYSCQAINTVGTKLATPDSIVSVTPKASKLEY